MDISVVIVTWNNAEVIAGALSSLHADLLTTGLQYEVWVVDSASTDGTRAMVRDGYSHIRLVACEENIGFGRANNLALRAIGFKSGGRVEDLPRAVYLLNPDTISQLGATACLYKTLFENEETGVVGARLSFADGSFQHSAFRFPGLRQIWTELYPTPGSWIEGSFNGRYDRSFYESLQPFAVDFTLGATMMLKREVLLETELFDEQFFLYCEEVDWAWRIKRRGWQILCVPQAQVTHLGASSTSQARPASLVNLWKSRLQLYDKHYPSWKRRLARKLVAHGMRRKLATISATQTDLIAACREVIEIAGS